YDSSPRTGREPQLASRQGSERPLGGAERMTASPERSGAGPLAVWLIGARGAVATTTIVGAAALRLGHARPIGLVTESVPLSAAPLAPLDSLVFGGHDVTDTPLIKSAHALCRDAGPLSLQLVRDIEDELDATEPCLRPTPPLLGSRPAPQFIRSVQEDLAFLRNITAAP